MGIDIYNTVVDVIGEVPKEMEIIYPICAIFLFLILIMVIAAPVIILLNSGRR